MGGPRGQRSSAPDRLRLPIGKKKNETAKWLWLVKCVRRSLGCKVGQWAVSFEFEFDQTCNI